MAKITIGPSKGESRTKVKVTILDGSALELDIGESLDMSVRQVEILERERMNIDLELARLSAAANAMHRSAPAVQAEADKIAQVAQKIVAERKWYSVSAAGLLEAAKAVGESASPVVGAAIKVIELLSEVYGKRAHDSQ